MKCFDFKGANQWLKQNWSTIQSKQNIERQKAWRKIK